MQLDRTTFEFTSKEKNSKVTFTVTKESCENNTVECTVTDLSGKAELKFVYKLDNSSDFENFSINLIQGLCPQFWIKVAKYYQNQINELVYELECRYDYFQHDAESKFKATRFSTYFNSKKDWFFLSLKNSNKMAYLSRCIINVLS
jgi:hypothetical protein